VRRINQQPGLKIFACGSVIVSSLIAANGSFQNALRASHGCGEYSQQFDPSAAILDAGSMMIPSVILLTLILVPWHHSTARISSLLIALVYATLVFRISSSDFINQYAPCDRKGDESSLTIVIIDSFALPILWIFLTASLEIVLFVYSRLKN
jgi:hypothetical protein